MENNPFLYHTLSCILDVAKMYLIIHYIIGFQKKVNKPSVHFALLLVPIYMGLILSVVPEKYVSILYLPIILIVLQITSGIWHVKSFLLSLIAYMIVCELDVFNSSIMKLTQTGMLILNQTNTMAASVVTLIAVGLVTVACNKLNVTFYKKNFGHKKAFVLIEVAVLFFNIGIIGIFFGVLSEKSAGSYASLLLNGIIVVSTMLSIITLIFYSVIMNVKEYQILNHMKQKQLELQKEHYERLKEISLETRKFQHDTKNHLLVMAELLQEKKYQEASEYIEEYTNQITDVKPAIQCGNYIADAILNEACSRCKSFDIELKVSGIIHASVQLNNTDMVTILGNAVDNAIEACQKINSEDRWIEVKFGLHQEYLNIIIKNSTNGRVTKSTQKKDRTYHGFGLNNIKDCVERNQGNVNIYVRKKEFEINIIVKAFEEIA